MLAMSKSNVYILKYALINFDQFLTARGLSSCYALSTGTGWGKMLWLALVCGVGVSKISSSLI